MLSPDDLVRLNQYAQDVRPPHESRAWFGSLSAEQKQDVLRELAVLFQEAHASPDDVPVAVQRAGLKPTHTPSVLMAGGPLRIQAAKVIALPESERDKAFCLFQALLAVSDERRRKTECVAGCSHWWHRDLSDELVVRRLLTQRS